MSVVPVKGWSSALQRQFLEGYLVWRGGSWAQEGGIIFFMFSTAAPPRLRLVSCPLSCRWAKAQKLLESVSALSLLRKYRNGFDYCK